VKGHAEQPGQDNDCDLVERLPEELFVPEDIDRDGTGPATLRRDPLTQRQICFDCWNCVHGTRKKPVCTVPNCRCGCKDGPEEQRRERSAHAAARLKRKALEWERLEAEGNLLRALNPSYRKPARNAKRGRKQRATQDSNFAVG